MTYHAPILYLTEGGSIISIFIASLLVIGVLLGIFLVIRALMLWYWKVDIIIRNQESQNTMLQYQNQLLEKQTQILLDTKTQNQKDPIDSNAKPLT